MFDLSIVIPAYNEEKRLPATLKEIANYLRSATFSAEVIVVDDGSRDRTKEVAEAMGRNFVHLRVIALPENRGKGQAVKEGMLAATGKAALFTDADNSTPIEEIEKLLPHLKTHEVVIGSRHLADSNVVIRQPWYRIAVSRVGNLLIQILLVPGVYDTQCGFKLFTHKACREIFSRQRTHGFAFDMEVLTIARRVLRYRIKEVPVSWYNSADSRVRPIHDALRTLSELFRIEYNFLMRKYQKPL